MALDYSHRRVAVYIDVQNMYYSACNLFGSKVNFGNIVLKSVGDQKLIRAVAYTISTKGGDETPFFEALHKFGIEINTKELLEYDSGHKKGDWDVGITIDVVRILDTVDAVILVSGDGDYVPLAEYVKNRGRTFHVVSFRESTSSKLVEVADVYTNLSDDKATYLINDPRYRPQVRKATLEPGSAQEVPTTDTDKGSQQTLSAPRTDIGTTGSAALPTDGAPKRKSRPRKM